MPSREDTGEAFDPPSLPNIWGKGKAKPDDDAPAAEGEAVESAAAPTPPEDPRALAKRLAEEAKARSSKQKKAEDPRALAKRLANEAKAKAAAKAASTPAPKKTKKKAPKKKSLAERARKPLSAKEALAAAIAKESAEASKRQAKAKAAPAAAPAEAVAPTATATATATAAAPAVAPAPVAPANPVDVAPVVHAVLEGATVGDAITVSQLAVFRALWTAHHARASSEGDVTLAVTAGVLMDAADRVPAGYLAGVRIEHDGTSYAAWIDRARGVLLGLTSPPEIYLAGL